jgi:type I restriction enzyme S subunit
MKWRSVSLKALAHVTSGAGAPQDPNAFTKTGHPFVRAGSLSKLLDGGTEDQLEKIEPEAARTHGLKLFPAGTVLFAKSGMSATKGYVYRLEQPAYVVSHLAALIPHHATDSAFLVHALRYFSPTSLIKDSAYPSIRLSDIEDMQIQAPSELDDRARLAAILNQADTLRRKKQWAISKVAHLAEAIFLQVFGDPIANPHAWSESVTLGEVADIVSGITKGRRLNGHLTREVPYLAVANVQDRALNLTTVKTIEATDEEINRLRLRKGDLLLTEGGDPDKLGRGTLWNQELDECIHQNHVFRVRVVSDAVTPLYLNWLIGSSRGKRYFLRSAKQTTGIASINMTQLRNFPLLLPPIELQNAFAARMSEIEALRTKQNTNRTQLDALFASLQHRAFRGEL